PGPSGVSVALNVNAQVQNFTLGSSSRVYFNNGTTLAIFGDATINGTVQAYFTDSFPSTGYIYFYGTNNHTISGTGRIILGSNGMSSVLRNWSFGSSTLTIGPGILIRG